MRNPSTSAAFAAVVGFLLGCGGLLGDGGGPAPEVVAAMDDLEGTALEASAEVLPPITLDGAGVPDADVGDGVQVLQVAPVGAERKALQAAVVFDRPMVSLTDLDSMNQSAPLTCDPSIPGRSRWAGTSTAVFIPKDGAFPLATAFTCTVPAGATAVDGVALEKALRFSFETPRPRLGSTSPRDGAEDVDLTSPVTLYFDQPVDAAAVAPHVRVTSRGKAVPVRVEGTGTEIRLGFERSADTAYSVSIEPGIVGLGGPLPSVQPASVSLRTYPPLRVAAFEPLGDAISPASGLTLETSTPVSEVELWSNLTIDPKPAVWSPPDGEWATRWHRYYTVFQPRTTYTVTLSRDVEDHRGQTLTGPASWTFTTGDYDPWLSVPRGLKLYAANNPPELPYKHLNASEVSIEVAPFDPSALARPEGWEHAARAALATRAQRRTGPGPLEPNLTRLGDTDLGALLTGGRGWVVTRFQAPNVVDWDGDVREHLGLMVVTDLGGTLKVGPGEVQVWVTSLSGGAPVDGVEVEVFAGSERVGAATTNTYGLATVEGAPMAGWRRWDDEIWARLSKGDDVSLVRMGWNDGLSPYNFGIYGSFEASGRDTASHGYTDRGVYRPGDPVYARATFRFQTATGLEVPQGQVRWELEDPRGENVASGEGALDDRGGFSLETALPSDGVLGGYSLSIAAQGEGWSDSVWLSVPARAYRPPAFRVDVTGPVDAVAGRPIQAVADARYLFGAPLRKGQVRWRAWTEERRFDPEDWDGWSFGPEYRWWDDDGDYRGGAGLLGEETGALADGRSTFTQTVQVGTSALPLALFLEAEVEDVDRQVIANRTEVLVHPGAFYVGLRSKARLPKAGEATKFEVVAVDPHGAIRRGVDVEVKVVRRTWDSIREKGMDGQWRWVSTAVDEPVATEPVSTGSAPAEVSFTPTEAGYHVITATAKDPDGAEITATESLYVVGAGYVGWGRSDDNRMELVPDKRSYQPGDTARILVKAPAEGLRALVSAEREGVLWRQVVTLGGTAASVEVPIDEKMLPNVFVSVVAIQGAGPQDAPDKGRPQVYMGMTELAVDAEGQHLAVDVEPSRTEYLPRDRVEVEVTVERGGSPVAGAGVTLYAVDEAILSLTAYQTPDPHASMYRHHALSVLTADGRVAALDRAPFLTKGADRGGDGGDAEQSGPETRKKFLTTITWQPDLRTDANGRVKASFELPDNLTTFRVMAVADAGAASFGAGDREIRVSRPLMLRPALPRHLRAGDEAFAGVVVHNDTDSARTVEVDAKVGGPVEVRGGPVTVKVAARASVEVPFTLRALEPGEAAFTFTASAGSDRDALEWKLPIGRDVMLETTATAGTIEGRVTEQIARPDGAHIAFGGLDVDLATTALVGSGAGLEYLLEYPHGCIEQKTSRALGSLVALAVRDKAGIEVSEDVLRRNVEGVLVELGEFRTAHGGLGYWKGSDWPSVMGTAYAVEFMGRAREAGFDIDEGALRVATSYLRDVAAGRRVPGAFDEPLLSVASQAYIASALARAGQGDAGLNQRLYQRRQDLSVFATATLLEAMLRTTGPDARAEELERVIASRTTIEAAGANVKENRGGRWARMWASDDLSTAAALEALVRADPKHVLAPKYALHLASSRRTGHWANTRATAAALAALGAYSEARETDGDAVLGTIRLAGAELLSQQVAVPGDAELELPLSQVENGLLELESKGGLLYYQARLSYAPKQLLPRDEGFTITRTFEILEGGGSSSQVTAGATVRVTLTVVTPVVRHDVALVDRLPAGLEPLDGSLATTSRAPREAPGPGQGTEELPEFGGSWVFDHNEIDDAEVRLYADYMPPGIHTFRYVARATTPGTFDHPPATVEEMYEPENFGRTAGGRFVVGAAKVAE